MKDIPQILEEISYDRLERIDLALEGDWNATVVTVWLKDSGLLGFEKSKIKHPEFKPSLELYFKDVWVGIHCYQTINGQNVFDKQKAEKIIAYIEKQLKLNNR